MDGPGPLDELRARAAEVCLDDRSPEMRRVRERVLQAVDIAAAALRTDPTLAAADRRRDLDVLEELVRQLRPLARQARLKLERRRLEGVIGTERALARLGRTNPDAPDHLDKLARYTVTIAERIADAALPDWDAPRRIRERSARLLPSPDRLADIAEQLRYAVQAVELPYPDPEAVRLAALADQIALTAHRRRPRCAGPGCDRELEHATTGRPRRYCSAVCRQRARRIARTTGSAGTEAG
ncbi:hypothetical protein ACFHW2_43360 [Actinomadura sp. LOL_016]|uniref:hypothetical protein n=1 Tax=unclassified Actinomadura TaxID=2626254 RepID=UPI003A80102F